MTRSRLDDLAARARADAPAPVDVRARVLAAVARRRAPAAEPALVWCAVGSLAAAAVVLILALPELQAVQEPLAGMFSALEGLPP